MSEAAERRPDQKPIKCVLVAAGKYHDIDFARLEILKLLAEDDRIRVRIFEDYENIEAIFICGYHGRANTKPTSSGRHFSKR